MTEPDLDAQIRLALLDATMERWAAVLEGTEELVWSPKRQRLMDKLCRDPFGTAKRRARPLWQKSLHTAACVLLVCSATFGGAVTFSPTARAWVQQVWAEWTELYATFYLQGTGAADAGTWLLNDLPEGYERISTEERAGGIWNIYENANGDQLYFDYMPVTDGGGFDFDNEHSIYCKIELNGRSAHLFLSNQEPWPSSLIWFDDTGEIGFQLVGNFTREALIQMAESVSKIE